MCEALIGFLGAILGGGIAIAGQWFMMKRQQKDLFRMAALDKRLEVHQEAYALWNELIRVAYEPEKRGEVVRKSQEWFDNNLLYLSPKVRQAFKSCIFAVSDYESKFYEDLMPKIMAPGNLIQTAVDLPPIGDIENVAEGPIQKSVKKD